MVKVIFELDAPAGVQPEGSLTLRPNSTSPGEPIVLPLRGREPAHIDLPAGSQWQVSSSVPGLWIARETLVIAATPAEVIHRLRAWPLATVTGMVRLLEAQERLPQEISVGTVELPASSVRRDVPVARVVCPLDSKGRFRCELPAGSLDLVVAARGFIPAYRWGVRLPAGTTSDLGRFDLRGGASVVGWVEAEGGSLDPKSCEVRLVALAPQGGDVLTARRFEAAAGRGTVRRDGFFQLSGVAPGVYRLEVHQPGYAPAALAPLSVPGRGETFINRPLTLQHLLRLELTLEPPVDWLGRPWEVQVVRREELGAAMAYGPAVTGRASDLGYLEIPEQAPGWFRVTVADSLGNRLLAAHDLAIESVAEAQQTLRIPFLSVRGRLRLGGEPLAASLWFGGRSGAVAVKMEAGEDGELAGVLPHGGKWPVEIAATEPKIAARRTIRLEAEAGKSAAFEIDLPNTRVFGSVIDQEGRPAPDAEVAIQSADDFLAVRSDEQGKFEARALSQGLTQLSAQQGRAASGQVGVFVPGQGAVGPVTLALRRLKDVSGLVLAAEAPVRGARVLILPWRPRLTPGDAVTTDLEGRFTAHLPERTGTMLMIVEAPGYALQAFEVPAEGSSRLEVSAQHGDLEVSLPGSADELADRGLALAVFQNGNLLPSSSLLSWALAHGARVAGLAGSIQDLPDLAPGAYRACLVDSARLREGEPGDWSRQLATCAAGSLSAGATLKLDLSAHPN